ncbi:hypothetical protein KOW79_007685 [Hemibagrus wyckioides]|uniref:Chemokine interleukin-8-like domain-containing protein n=1 Tax=Hemibagrus wyckioides TaxID=337641 RepID=A0A9D3SLV4_9TELE|nr:C-C motif chemokine 4-like [Hemibagrus wyckioides]KAG7329511.1 hypothetical protein KOW79_007685 [Hemibagrus wyckioides]
MKNLMALLFLMSFCFLQLVFNAPTGFDHKTSCCSNITNMRIPVKNIVKHWWISSDCPKRAIVFETNNKEKGIEKKFCVDPTAGWVKNYMKAVDQKNKAAVSLQTSQPQQ